MTLTSELGRSSRCCLSRVGVPVAAAQRLATRAAGEFSASGDEVGDKNADVFDRELKSKQRDRAAWFMHESDPILDTVTENLLDRLEDCKRMFPTALNLGGALDHVQRMLHGRGGIERLISMDTSVDMIGRSKRLAAMDGVTGEEAKRSALENMQIIADEEYLPFQAGSLDVVISSLGLHWVNDLPGAMSQCRTALKPDGLFLAAMFGGETLRELRIACTVAQLEREGGVSPRISPLAQVRDAGNLLTRAGFALPTVDVDEYTVRYPSAMELIEHLRSMGEVNAVRQRSLVMSRDTALATASIYQSMFGESDGTIPATFQVIYMAGWSPDISQKQPKRRGSATVSFQDLQTAFPPDAFSKTSDDPKSTSTTKSITELASESKERERTGHNESEETSRTTRLPSGSWFKLD
ncbi:unnamed protein product [Sphagnum troendelagicum]